MSKTPSPFTMFTHRIEDALIGAKLNGTQWALTILVQRKTVGWGKPGGDYISLTEFADTTGFNRIHIQSELQRLRTANILIQVASPTFHRPGKWRLNEDPESWNLEVLGKTKTVQRKTDRTVQGKPNRGVKEKADHQENSLKERGNKETSYTSPNGVTNEIFRFWTRAENLISHRTLSARMRREICARMSDGYTVGQIKTAISRYSELKMEDAAPGYGNWGLADLLGRDGGGYLDKLCDPKFEGFSRTRNTHEVNRQTLQRISEDT